MIQDVRETEPNEQELTAAKARLRSAARRRPSAHAALPDSPRHAVAKIAADNPAATAAVAFALVAAIGPGRLLRMASFAFRAAPLGMVAWKAIQADRGTHGSPPGK